MRMKDLIMEDYTPRKNKVISVDIDGKRADTNIKYCKSCRRTWEKHRKTNGKSIILFYEEVPSYGKEKVICYRCK